MKLISVAFVSLCVLSLQGMAVAAPTAREKASSSATAEVKMTLTIVDDLGVPLEEARWYSSFKNPKTGGIYLFETNEHGRVEFVCEAPQQAEYCANTLFANRCYETRSTFHLEPEEGAEGLFGGRRWKPVEETIVVKRRRNPSAMFSHTVYEKPIPVFNQALAFDLRIADWVKPYGEGEVADITISVCTRFSYAYGSKERIVDRVILECPRAGDGMQLLDADCWSELRSSHIVDVSRPFQRQLVLKGGLPKKSWLPSDKYLVFRTRSTYNDSGELIGCHYSKLYPAITVDMKTLSIKSITFNPNNMDRNLEFERLSNLTLRSERGASTKRQDIP